MQSLGHDISMMNRPFQKFRPYRCNHLLAVGINPSTPYFICPNYSATARPARAITPATMLSAKAVRIAAGLEVGEAVCEPLAPEPDGCVPVLEPVPDSAGWVVDTLASC